MAGKIEEKLQEQTAATAFQLVWGTIKGVSNLVIDENTVQHGMKEYARQFLERYGNVKILNMDQPVPLSDIYVAAQVISPRAAKSFSSVEDLHEMFLQQGRRRLFPGDRKEGRRDCLELANELQYLNVLGAPGAGKSTFLRRLGLEALRPRRTWNDSILRSMGLRAGLNEKERSRYEHDCLPVLIELRRFRTDEIDLVTLIQKELAICGLPESEKLVKALLEDGRLLLLLDGVDEVPSDRLDKAITHIHDFVDRYSGNSFVISCRTAFYKSYFSRFRDVLLADFDDEQISNFVHNWFRSDQDRQRGIAEEFLKILGEPANASANELASTPLLLTFLCLTYDDRQRLPPNRSELYRQALEILMERWAASKRVHNEPVYRELHARLEVRMLAEIAAPAFRDNRYFFTRSELIDRITGFLRDELNAPKHLDGDQVLNAIEVQQGLIVQRAQDAWSFSHLTLQEYLTAVWYKGDQRLEELVSKYLFDVRWREVFILLAGTVDKADNLLKRMQEAAEAHLADQLRALQLVRWASSKAALVTDAEETVARRAFALALARDLASIFDLTSALDRDGSFNRALAISRALERPLDRSLDRALSLSRALAHSRVLDRAFVRPLVRILDGARSRPLDSAIDQAIYGAYVENLLALLSGLDSSQLLSGPWHEAGQQVQAIRDQPSKDASLTEILKAWKQVLNIFANALHLPPELCASGEEGDTLESYLYACQLIIDCRNAATGVSRSIWAGICQRMLNPLARPSANGA
jgi:NACHT domain